MIKQQPCPTCVAERDMELVRSSETVTIKGHAITFEAEFYVCSVCGTEIEEPDQLDRNLDAAREMYERLYATPSPTELVALRESYGASQKAFSLLLGFGESTMNSYEQGKVPDSANRLLLRLAQDPVVFKKIYEQNKDKIGMLQRKRVEASEGYKQACEWVTVTSSQLRASFTSIPQTGWKTGPSSMTHGGIERIQGVA